LLACTEWIIVLSEIEQPVTGRYFPHNWRLRNFIYMYLYLFCIITLNVTLTSPGLERQCCHQTYSSTDTFYTGAWHHHDISILYIYTYIWRERERERERKRESWIEVSACRKNDVSRWACCKSWKLRVEFHSAYKIDVMSDMTIVACALWRRSLASNQSKYGKL